MENLEGKLEAYKQELLEKQAKRIKNAILAFSYDFAEYETAEKTTQVKHTLQEQIQNLFPENAENLKIISEGLNNLNEDTVVLVSSQLATELFRNYPPDEIKHRIEQNIFTNKGYEKINDLLRVKISEEAISLHVAENFDKNPKELLSLIKDGLIALAKKIDHEEFKSIKEISGRSWICYEQPQLLEKFGFNVIERDNASHTAKAIISKKRLIELYKKDPG